MSKLCAGLTIALRSEVVRRGNNKPLLLFGAAFTSNNAEAFGVAPLVLMPMFWQKAPPQPSPSNDGRESQHTRLMQSIFILYVDVIFISFNFLY